MPHFFHDSAIPRIILVAVSIVQNDNDVDLIKELSNRSIGCLIDLRIVDYAPSLPLVPVAGSLQQTQSIRLQIVLLYLSFLSVAGPASSVHHHT